MNFGEIKELVKLFDDSSLTDLHITLDNTKIKLSKNPGKTAPKTLIVTEGAKGSLPEISGDVEEPITILPKAKKEKVDGSMVISPIVGTFYDKPAPDKPAFVTVGDRVKPGQVVCIVEAMKVMNEITSPYGGMVAEIFVKNESIVEYNQPLVRIVEG